MDIKIIIKMNLDSTDYGPVKEMRKKWMKYSADLGGLHMREHVIVTHDTHKIQVVNTRDYQGNPTKKIVISIGLPSTDREFDLTKKEWLNFYSKQFGGKHLKKHILIVPTDHTFGQLDVSFFNDLNEQHETKPRDTRYY